MKTENMLNRILFALIATFLCVCNVNAQNWDFKINTCYQSGPTYYTTTALNMREHMDTQTAVVGQVPKGEAVIVTNSFFGSMGWWEVCYEGKTGWVKKAYLSQNKPSSSNSYNNNNSSSNQSNSSGTFSPFLAKSTNSVSLRSQPNSNSYLLREIPYNSDLYIFSSQETNGYYKAIDIATGKVGYVYKNYVKYVKQADVNYSGNFQKTGYSSSYNSQVEVINQSSYNITLVVGDETYTLSPNSTRNLSLSPGKHNYVATAPGVIPASGVQNFQSNSGYSWTFYVSTSRY